MYNLPTSTNMNTFQQEHTQLFLPSFQSASFLSFFQELFPCSTALCSQLHSSRFLLLPLVLTPSLSPLDIRSPSDVQELVPLFVSFRIRWFSVGRAHILSDSLLSYYSFTLHNLSLSHLCPHYSAYFICWKACLRSCDFRRVFASGIVCLGYVCTGHGLLYHSSYDFYIYSSSKLYNFYLCILVS